MNAISDMNPANRLAEAELEKVRLEIEQLKRPPYRKVAFWTGIVIPVVAFLASLITGVLTGFFDDQLKDLQKQKGELQTKLENARETELLLSEKNTALTREIQTHQIMVNNLEGKANELEDIANQLNTASTTATEGLETIFDDLNHLLGQKGDLYNLVINTEMDDQSKQEFLDQLASHLQSIQATETRLRSVQDVLQR